MVVDKCPNHPADGAVEQEADTPSEAEGEKPDRGEPGGGEGGEEQEPAEGTQGVLDGPADRPKE